MALSISSKASEVGLNAWRSFREIHPYGYQAVGLKHDGDRCIFIISEPPSEVTDIAIKALFSRYGGSVQAIKQPIGHDGWLCDMIGELSFDGSEGKFEQFSKDLFSVLYSTDYKAYYIDLDSPKEHVYYSAHRLNYSISAAEIEQWFLKDNEQFTGPQGKNTIKGLLSGTIPGNSALYYSQGDEFVIWALNRNTSVYGISFRTDARKFALDTDLIIGAIGSPGGNFAVIARKRQIPLEELPPLRTETLTLLMDTSNDHLAQSYERYAVFAGKQKDGWDVAPIYLSPELQHTEYGILLNNTDQMLKSWSENGAISYQNFSYPTPVYWGFNDGAYNDLGVSELTYNWNTAGAGYVIQNDGDFDIYAINRTGCLPVSFIPSGMEGKMDQEVNDAEELAYDFFSDLQNVDLVRVVQYAAIYQIASHFKATKETVPTGIDYSEYHRLDFSFFPSADLLKHNLDSLAAKGLVFSKRSQMREGLPTPSFDGKDDSSYLIGLITNLLKNAYRSDQEQAVKGLERFIKRAKENGPKVTLSKLVEKDPYGEFESYVADFLDYDLDDNLLDRTESELEEEYYELLQPNVDTVRNYIARYTARYGEFPYDDAAKLLLNRDASHGVIQSLSDKREAIVNEFLQEQDELEKKIDTFNRNVDEYNKNINSSISDIARQISAVSLRMDRESIEKQSNYLEKKIRPKVIAALQDIDKEIERIQSLNPSSEVQLAVGTLNWLWTDPAGYDAPIGDFYASHFGSHRLWIKTPSIVQSIDQRNLSSYGGHNLDAHITPIKVASKASQNLPKGYCRVTVENGNRIINVAGSDKARLTPATLRTIERKALEGTFRLPEAPPIRAKSCIKDHSTAMIANRTALFEGKTMTDAEFMEQLSKDLVNQGTSPVKEIHFSGYDARRVRAFADNLQDRILERSIENDLNLKNFDINEDIQVISGSDGNARIIIKQRPSTISVEKCIDAELILTVPEQSAPAVKKSLINIFDRPSEQLDNPFKWKRQLRLDLESTQPGFDFYDIVDEYHQVYSFIFNHRFFHHVYEIYPPENPLSSLAA